MDVNTGVAMELKKMAGLEMEMSGVMGKSKEMAGMEVERVGRMEGGVATKVGMELKSMVGASRNIGRVVGTGRAIATARGDVGADMQSTVVGTNTRDDVVVVVG